MRVLVAGFEHETNTFAPTKAAYHNFVNGEGYPAMMRGPEVFRLRDVNLATGGFIRAAEERGYDVIPVIWAGASASAHVTTRAFERIVGEILTAASTNTFDAIYLNLHGAMVTERHDDGEGELLRRLRGVVGADMPIFCSVDLHANMTEAMLSQATGIVGYQTYPHIDNADTGFCAVGLHDAFLKRPDHWFRAARRLPFLIPVNAQCTMVEPALSTYAFLREKHEGDVLSLSFAPGFPASDFAECGPMVWGYGRSQDAVNAAVDAVYDRITSIEAAWAVEFYDPDSAVREAMRLAAGATRPVIISDTQDNPGSGADSDTTGMLRALLRCGADEAALGVLYDPEAVTMATKAGVGACVTLALGGRSGTVGDEPLHGNYEVEYVGDGRCIFEGPMLRGTEINLHGAACLKIRGIRIVVSATKVQMFDRNLYRMVGVQPEAMKILVNKSSVHFRADFGPISEAILVAKAPGPMKADPRDLPWTKLPKRMRLSPCQ